MRTPTHDTTPAIRVRAHGERAARVDGKYVLYWMIAQRRRRMNFGLQRAADWAHALNRPLVVLEPLRSGYPWASDRLHRWVVDGMCANRDAFADDRATYFPYLEPRPGDGSGLLAAMAENACVVVTDTFPCFFLPRMVRAAAEAIPIRFEEVDGNGLLPLRASERVYHRAHDFRRFLQKSGRPHLDEFPRADPLTGLPQRAEVDLSSIYARWPRADLDKVSLDRFPIDHVVPTVSQAGGSEAARRVLETFVQDRLPRYGDDRNHPDDDTASGLSPYLHFGHIGAHEVLDRVFQHEDWHPDLVSTDTKGRRTGWWGMSPSAESFLDQLITWRELGYHFAFHEPRYSEYESLPAWARTTLDRHRYDARPYIYDIQKFENAATHDPLWNAAQNQLREEGRIHNYLRMLWGKKILHWTASPEAALEVMTHLNNKWAIDGRDPNSYSGIFWTLGRFDRAWGPEREVFGKVRYMTSTSAARKLRLRAYVERWTSEDQLSLL